MSKAFCVLCKTMDEAAEAANRVAPEHLELIVKVFTSSIRLFIHILKCFLLRVVVLTEFLFFEKDANSHAFRFSHYGALFIGSQSAEVFGDYGIGPNHTLPTSGTARFSGGSVVICSFSCHLNVSVILEMFVWEENLLQLPVRKSVSRQHLYTD